MLLFLLWPLLHTATIVSATSIVTPAVANNVDVVVVVVVDGSAVTVPAAVVAAFLIQIRFPSKTCQRGFHF